MHFLKEYFYGVNNNNAAYILAQNILQHLKSSAVRNSDKIDKDGFNFIHIRFKTNSLFLQRNHQHFRHHVVNHLKQLLDQAGLQEPQVAVEIDIKADVRGLRVSCKDGFNFKQPVEDPTNKFIFTSHLKH